MIGTNRVLGLIPARGGSKGLPGKHLLPAGGKPLLAWTIEAARGARVLDRLVLSSDDDAIVTTALEYGCEAPFRRPPELATDEAASIDVVLHALDQLPGYDLVVLLQPTAPLRSATDIDAACERLVASGAPACVSLCPVEHSPYWMYRLDEADRLRPVAELPPDVTRRQRLPRAYLLNGAIYIARVEWLRESRNFVGEETVAYVMPAERSIDIDTRADFEAFRRAISDV
jgi:N-acylneuraminate cytidylyltransferase